MTPWWGDHPLDSEGRARFRIGSLSLWVRKHAKEWWLARVLDPLAPQESEDDSTEPATDLEAAQLETPPDTARIERVAVASDGRAVRLRPQLADRSVVSRPETPLTLPPLASVDLYLSTPVWVQIETLDPTTGLLDIPTRQLSQTWFGPSTMFGEVGYAVRTRARLELHDRPIPPHRVLSKVTVHNDADASLLIERINLPARSLSLFVDRRGRLWTSSIFVARKRDGRLAEVRLEENPPAEAEDPEKLSPARDPEPRNYLARALNALIG